MSAIAAKRKFPAKAYVLSLVAIALFGLWPIFSVLLTSTLAETYGCIVDEGSVHPCMIGGVDWGEALYAMGVMGWFMLLTLPAAAFAGMVWMVALLVHFGLWLKRS